MPNIQIDKLRKERDELLEELTKRQTASIVSILEPEYSKAVYTVGVPAYFNTYQVYISNTGATPILLYNSGEYTFVAKYIMSHLLDINNKIEIEKDNTTPSPLTIKIYTVSSQVSLTNGNILTKEFLSNARHPFELSSFIVIPKGNNLKIEIINNTDEAYYMDFALLGFYLK